MINFIEWVDRNHPEIKSLKDLDKSVLYDLVNEFEHGKLTHNDVLTQKWKHSFEYNLFENSGWEGYDNARRKLYEFEKRDNTYKDDLDMIGIQRREKNNMDYLTRRKETPLRAMFLFTSEDFLIENYIKQNYDAIDSLSSNFCDIYISMNQLLKKENAYDHLDKIDIIKKVENISISKLPGILFWDHTGESEYISFQEENDNQSIKIKIRFIFDAIRKKPTLASIKDINY
jgi:hypothetical protein